MKKIFALILLISVILMSAAACGGAPSSPSESVSPSTQDPAPAEDETKMRFFTDSAGRQVELPDKITRVAVTGTMAQIALFALCPDALVGIASEWDSATEGYIPEKYHGLPVLGQFYSSTKGDVNLEQIAAVNPQVIIDIGEAKNTIAEDMDGMTEQIGIPAVHITATIPSMDEAYRKLGELMGLPERAEILAEYCREIFDRTSAIAAQVEGNKKDLLYCLGENGLNVIAKDSYHSEVIDMLSNNLAVLADPSSKGTGNETDMEQLLLWDPEIIIFAPDSIYSDADKDPAWRQLSAIQNGSYYRAPLGPYGWIGNPPSVNRYMGMIWLAGLLYPETAGYDLYDEAVRYYELFYHHTLTRDQFDELTSGAVPGLV